MKRFLVRIFINVFLFSAFLAACKPAAESPTPKAPSVDPTDTATPEPVQPWEVLFELDVLPHSVRIAAFHNETLGFTGGGGSRGNVRITYDGGQTWTASENSSF